MNDWTKADKGLFLLVIFALIISGCMSTTSTAGVGPTATSAKTLNAESSTEFPKPSPTKPTTKSPMTSTRIVSTIIGTPTPAITETKGTPSRTPTSTKTPRPTRTPSNTWTPRPTKTFTPTATLPTPPIHDAPIKIFSPGSISRVISPFNLNMTVATGSRGQIFMLLIGEDGEILVSKIWDRAYASGGRTSINEMIEFPARVTAESARLVIYTLDEYKRLTALATEDLVLLKVGEEELADSDNLKEPFALYRPYADQNLKDGKILVEGAVRCRVDCRLVVELVNPKGEMIARFEEPSIIQASLKYEWIKYEYQVDVTRSAYVRLIIRAQDIFTADDIAATSMLVRVLP